MTKKNNKLPELAEALLKWAEEDEDNRSVLLITDDEENATKVYCGKRGNLVAALAGFMSTDEDLRDVCVRALFMSKENKANDHDEAETDND